MSKRGAEDLLVSPEPEELKGKKMDLKLTPTKEDEGDQCMHVTDDAVMTKIKAKAPEWFGEAFTYIISTIKEQTHSTSVIQKHLESKVELLEKRISNLEKVNKEQESVITKLKENMDNLEAYLRRDNLVIEGIMESPNENIRNKVTEFLKTKLCLTDASEIKLSCVHRIGVPPHLKPHASVRPRPTIVRFQNYIDRERAWRSSWNLHEKHLFVREDYTEAMKQRRNKLLPVLKAAKRDPSVKKCTLRGDKLIIDGKRYTTQEFDKIPEHLRWTIKGERYFPLCNSTFFFWKRLLLEQSPYKSLSR